VAISFLTVGLILSSSSNNVVFAENPRDVCGSQGGSQCKCANYPSDLTASCCSFVTDTTVIYKCETCDINTDTGDFENCRTTTPGSIQPPTPTPTPPGPAAPQQGGGVLEQPPTGPAAPQQGGGVLQKQDQDTTQTGNDNNQPSLKHKAKHSEDSSSGNLDLPQTGKLTTKKGGNNDNSPTPPACPDKGPIPPDCTLKPKF
jgi:hypothetical protein